MYSYCFDNSVDVIGLCQNLLTTISREADKCTMDIHTYAIKEIKLADFGILLNKVGTRSRKQKQKVTPHEQFAI